MKLFYQHSSLYSHSPPTSFAFWRFWKLNITVIYWVITLKLGDGSCFWIFWILVTDGRLGPSVLFLINKLVCDLWLTERQISKLEESFIRKSDVLVHAPLVAHQRSALIDNIRKIGKEMATVRESSISSLIRNTNTKVLSEELAEPWLSWRTTYGGRTPLVNVSDGWPTGGSEIFHRSPKE